MADERTPQGEMGMEDEAIRNKEIAAKIDAVGKQIVASFEARLQAVAPEQRVEQTGKWDSGTDVVVDGKTVRWTSDFDKRGGTVRDFVYDEKGNNTINIDHYTGPSAEGRMGRWAEFAYDENGQSPKYLSVNVEHGGLSLEVNEVISGNESSPEQRRGGKLEKEAALKLIQDLADRLQQPTAGYLGDREDFFDSLSGRWKWKSGDSEVTRLEEGAN